jgi:hypothetical protein
MEKIGLIAYFRKLSVLSFLVLVLIVISLTFWPVHA